ncbi:MAG: metal ABC transporter substrate-binding protein [Clostridiales bacterium]|nr:metal ABC transporter substrate-binding protein [Clostridiales bacterium]
MKKIFLTILTVALICAFTLSFVGCTPSTPDDTIVIGASSTPHAEILEQIRADLEAEGFKLDIKIYTDYVLPNTALEDGSLDANYFQHTPYLNDFNKNNGTHILSVEKIHYEPFAVYGKNVSKEDFEATKTGRTILIPDDGTNCTRALLVLRDNGYITLKDGVKPSDSLSDKDIVDNNGNTVVLVAAENVPAQLNNANAGTIAVINGNYALEANLDVKTALAVENASGDAAQLYANIIAVKEGNENSAKTKALIKALKTQKVFNYITEHYNGAVLPVFTV